MYGFTGSVNMSILNHLIMHSPFYDLLVFCEEIKTYAIEHYPKLIHFLIFWFLYKKFRFVPLVGPK
jgi:hypothetical protein